MQRPCYLNLQQLCELVAVRHGAGFFCQTLEDHVCVIRAAEKCSVDPHSSSPDQRRRCPDQYNPKHCAQSHPEIRILADESRENVGEEHDGRSRNHEHENDKAPLHQDVPRTASQQHRKFHHAMLHHCISE